MSLSPSTTAQRIRDRVRRCIRGEPFRSWNWVQPSELARFVDAGDDYIKRFEDEPLFAQTVFASPRPADAVCRDAFARLARKLATDRVVYDTEPLGPDRSGQTLRLPEQIEQDRKGTCIDLALLAADLLSALGLRPLIAVSSRHVLVVVDPELRQRDGVAGPTGSDGWLQQTDVNRLLRDRSLWVLEPTALVARNANSPAPFDDETFLASGRATVRADLEPWTIASLVDVFRLQNEADIVPRRQRDLRCLVGATAGLVTLAAVAVGLVATVAGSWVGRTDPDIAAVDEIEDGDIVLVVTDLASDSAAAAQFADLYRRRLLEFIEEQDVDDRLTVVTADESIEAETVSSFTEGLGHRVDIVVYGSAAETIGLPGNFTLDVRLFANGQAPLAFIPVGLNEQFAPPADVSAATFEADAPLPTSVAALVNTLDGLGALSASGHELALTRFEDAAAGFPTTGVPPVIAGLQAHTHLLAATTGGDDDGIKRARQALDRVPAGEQPNSTFVTLTDDSTQFLELVGNEVPTEFVQGCTASSNFAPDVDALQRLAEDMATRADGGDPLAAANANALLGRIRLALLLSGPRDDVGDQLDGVRQPFETVVRIAADDDSLRFWRSDAEVNLGRLRLITDRPAAIVHFQRALNGAPPVWQASHLAEIGRMFECVLGAEDSPLADDAVDVAACYYDFAASVVPSSEEFDRARADLADRKRESGGVCGGQAVIEGVCHFRKRPAAGDEPGFGPMADEWADLIDEQSGRAVEELRTCP